jgi:hypothetical protein
LFTYSEHSEHWLKILNRFWTLTEHSEHSRHCLNRVRTLSEHSEQCLNRFWTFWTWICSEF